MFSSDIFKRPKSEEEILAAKKLCLSPEIISSLSQTQELFDACVPNSDTIKDETFTDIELNHTELDDHDEGYENFAVEENRIVPTLVNIKIISCKLKVHHTLNLNGLFNNGLYSKYKLPGF